MFQNISMSDQINRNDQDFNINQVNFSLFFAAYIICIFDIQLAFARFNSSESLLWQSAALCLEKNGGDSIIRRLVPHSSTTIAN